MKRRELTSTLYGSFTFAMLLSVAEHWQPVNMQYVKVEEHQMFISQKKTTQLQILKMLLCLRVHDAVPFLTLVCVSTTHVKKTPCRPTHEQVLDQALQFISCALLNTLKAVRPIRHICYFPSLGAGSLESFFYAYANKKDHVHS